MMKQTVEIKIWGIVQGVGFRPFISRIAAKHGITGTVLNEGGNVRIIASGDSDAVNAFCDAISAEKPEASEIVYLEKKVAAYTPYESFKIIQSSEGEDEIIFIPPDLSICQACERELFDSYDSRHLHPFISCMSCGPRYSIVDKIPYDRHNTSMVDFDMCDFCNKQYTSIEDRRYHAQTISCHNCGPMLIYKDKAEKEALEAAISDLRRNGIVAVKGVGGYHLACTPFASETVEKLRSLKGREEKPFAVMFKDISEIRKYCLVSKQEEKLLQSKAKPIVLLRRKQAKTDTVLSQSVYKSSRFLGVFLPYTPLQHLLLQELDALIMTSANISDQPIIISDDEMLAMNSPYLSGVLYNKRDIRIRIDDSVAKCIDGKVQFIRRARGYAPLPVFVAGEPEVTIDKNSEQILACGGQLKNTFCLTKGSFVYPSQFIGDIEDEATFNSYIDNIERMQRLFRIKPDKVVCDMHPNYMTTQFAAQYAQEQGLPLLRIQHHFAHIASVMAEKGLREEVIGVAFDGTGYGDDGKIWGSEFLICTHKGYSRAAHLKYIPMIGGDASMKEAWKSAYMHLYAAGLEHEIKDERWPVLKAALLNKINTIDNSSMGRLFDAVSAILNIQQVANFEGECAIKLENEAAEYAETHNINEIKPYSYSIMNCNNKLEIDVSACIKGIVDARNNGFDNAYIAFKFHKTVADIIMKVCLALREQYKINAVALSGGVFQNSVLFELALSILRAEGFIVHYNTIVPPNDGCIALGQAYAGMNICLENK